jgi:hypothetical protein
MDTYDIDYDNVEILNYDDLDYPKANFNEDDDNETE